MRRWEYLEVGSSMLDIGRFRNPQHALPQSAIPSQEATEETERWESEIENVPRSPRDRSAKSKIKNPLVLVSLTLAATRSSFRNP